MQRVVTRFAKPVLIIALMVSIGAQWAVLQSAAWVGMAVSYSIKAGSVKEGLSKTFDGEHPCPMCELVAKGKASEKKDPKADAKVKFELFAQQYTVLAFAKAAAHELPRAVNEAAPSRHTPPPVPPPRCGQA